ncbi:Periplasmic nitrate reductase protein NapE [Roseovarius albus]|uniref:Periplasmic nitrate reductase protein NapE n=1 Tax=Roseovarius albus TaxID=1247867 RepID=A0A1X6Y9M4_9RHOB|nr:periplasmic nitrate reductase, NapE protein [Roseovarius albus]SLN12934.1 Periplasmic nitrate reductase protein NapE [Roseovarius albus]
MSHSDRAPAEQVQAVSKSSEVKMFLFLAVLLAPILSVVLVGGYGFIIWMSQILLGPPSH